jgi:predicted DNA-binding transcriptional regulator AlpA
MASQSNIKDNRPGDNLLSGKDVARWLGYRNRQAFWNTVRAEGIPYVRINPKVVRFSRAAVESWIASRTTNQGGR